eukprot:TRINITY_DN1063_c0_g3_i1.p1 TRINITY_DN1063_c0_g3~~TRINITY_DN1063_c0_g3_i1.p1  ORF type:complete len:269 (+),score=24.82 TRINITY_DN1063_c0_g3_i1:143-949(+)
MVDSYVVWIVIGVIGALLICCICAGYRLFNRPYTPYLAKHSKKETEIDLLSPAEKRKLKSKHETPRERSLLGFATGDSFLSMFFDRDEKDDAEREEKHNKLVAENIDMMGSTVLYLQVLEASLSKKCTMFATIRFGHYVFRTSVSSSTTTPFWAQKCRILINGSHQYRWPLNISIWEKRSARKNKLLASCHFDIHEFMGVKFYDWWKDLDDSTNAGQTGRVHVEAILGCGPCGDSIGVQLAGDRWLTPSMTTKTATWVLTSSFPFSIV